MAIGHGSPVGSPFTFNVPGAGLPATPVPFTNGTFPGGGFNLCNYGGEDSLWNWSPPSSAIIAQLTQQKALNNNTLSQQFFNNLYYDYQIEVDTKPPSTHRPITLLGAGVALLGNKRRFFHKMDDDPSVWQPAAYRNNAAFAPSTAAATIPRAPFYAPRPSDDFSWQKQPPQRSTALPFVPAITNRWRLDPSDDQLWSLTIQRDLPLNTVTASPSTSRQSSFFVDDPPLWQGAPVFSKTLPMLTANKPIQPRQWLFGYDDPAYWGGRPISAAPIPMLTVGGVIKAKQWHYDNDDPSMWSGWANRNTLNITTAFVAPNPFVPVFYRFHADDPAIWQQPPQRSVALPFVPSIVNRWRSDPPDDQPWSLTAQHNQVLSAPTQAPFTVHWRLDIPDDQPWSPTRPRVSSLMAVTVSPFTGRQYSFYFDDLAVWQPIRFRSIALPTVPAIHNRQKQDVPDDQLWMALLHRNDLLTLIATAPPSPFTLRQPSFAYDDFSSWTWLPRNNRFLPYVITPSTRIANTMQDVRNVNVQPLRSASTSADLRTSNTSDGRSVDTPAGTRSTDTKPKT